MMRVLVAIKSCRRYAARRRAVRATWLPSLGWADHVFLIGGSDAVSEENVLLLPDHSDAFANIAPKVRAACRWTVESEYDYLFICDDDTYVRPERLREAIPRGSDYVGYRRDGQGFGWPYMQGAAYWLSARAARWVAGSPIMVDGIIDDGAVGKALDGTAMIWRHDGRYEPGPLWEQRHPLRSNDLITTHKTVEDEMFEADRRWEVS